MRLVLLIALILGAVVGCDPYENPLGESDSRHEILIYSGITMSDAIFNLKNEFEKDNDCKIQVMYGASGYLKQVIEVNRKGDIFFPGNASYIESFKNNRIVTRQVEVGYNTLSFFVSKGNHLRLNGDLNQLLRKDLRVVIGAQGAGSVGRETHRLLKAQGILDKALANAISFSTDSKGLVSAIKNDEADLAINWRAVAFIDKNKPFITPVAIDSEFTRKVPLVMGLLKYSYENECANKFLDFVSSEKGHNVFSSYGFTD